MNDIRDNVDYDMADIQREIREINQRLDVLNIQLKRERSWRIVEKGDELAFEKFENGKWILKGSFIP